MKKKGLTRTERLLEGITVVLAVVYEGLQIYYGIAYHAGALRVIMNMLIFALLYVGFTLLLLYPERVNGLSVEVCSGKIKTYTIRMVQLIKLAFVSALLFSSICDALGQQIDSVYSLVAMGVIVVIAAVCEIQIIRELRRKKK